MTTRAIVDAIIAGNDAQAKSLFELAMAQNTKSQLEDYKSVIGQTMFESSAPVGMLTKQTFTIHAIDPSKKSDRLPEGEPVQYNVGNFYGPSAAYRAARDKGHIVQKVVDESGRDVTSHAKFNYDYGNVEHFNESAEILEAAAPGMEDWIKANKQNFIDQYGKKKGLEVLYATAWKKSKELNEDLDRAYSDWQSEVAKKYPEHSKNLRFVSKLDAPNQISAEIKGKDRSFGIFDYKTGKGQVLGEDTAVGEVGFELGTERRTEKEQEAAELAKQASQQKAPTIQDVVSVLGNTVSVADTSVVN